MGRKIDLTNKKFGRWTVLHEGKVDKHNHQYWVCKCSCGTIKEVLGSNLIRNDSSSCGCYNQERRKQKFKKKQPNEFYVKDDCIVLLDENKNECLIDKDSYSLVYTQYWKKNQSGYWIGWDNATNKSLKIHRVIMSAKEGDIIDHISGDRSDNRKSNLRFCTSKQNTWNSKPPNGTQSPCPGVKRYCRNNTRYNWEVTYHSRLKGYHIGLFETFEEAVYARQYLEKVLRGEFVKLNNFPSIVLNTEKQKSIEEKIIKKIKEKNLL